MLITQGKTNIIYLLIVIIIAVVVGGGVLWFVWNSQTEDVVPNEYCKKDADCGFGTIQGDPMEFGCVLGGITDEGPPNFKCICNKDYTIPKCEE